MPRSFMPLTLLKNLANTHFQEICPNGLQVRIVYKSEWSTCRSLGPRFLAVYWLKKSFLSKVKGMNDRGIRLTFPLYALVLPKYEI